MSPAKAASQDVAEAEGKQLPCPSGCRDQVVTWTASTWQPTQLQGAKLIYQNFQDLIVLYKIIIHNHRFLYSNRKQWNIDGEIETAKYRVWTCLNKWTTLNASWGQGEEKDAPLPSWQGNKELTFQLSVLAQLHFRCDDVVWCSARWEKCNKSFNVEATGSR